MQNTLQSTSNYDQHNAWYNSVFATEIKTEPGTSPIPQHVTPPPAPTPTTPHSQLEQYLKHQHQQNLNAAMNATTAMTPSPHNINDGVQHFFDSKMQQQLIQQQQYQQQFQQAQQAAAQNRMAAAAAAAAAATHLPLGFNPLTPPGLPMTTLPHFYNNNTNNNNGNGNGNINSNGNGSGPTNNHQTPSPQPVTVAGTTQIQFNTPMDINAYEKMQSALTPRNTPPMDAQINQNTNKELTQTSQQDNENDTDKEHDTMSNSSEDLTNLQDEAKYYESIHVPRYNSHGKLRTYPCKSCPQFYDTKAEYWEHLLTHIKPEKILRCPMYPKCPFVTEYKHFLDFHLKKHKNQKPFKCPEPGCKYSCETKGMLTSHLKSHSDVYPYKCGDCDYAVKFIHSFKQHLRKYEHKPGVVLDDKGKPNPAAVIDVYGRRRGPKSKGGVNGANGSTNGSTKRDRSQSLTKSTSCTSQLSAALQGIKMVHQHQQQQQQQQQLQQQQQQQQQQHEQSMCISPAKSNNSSKNEVQTPQSQRNASPHMQLTNLQQQQQNLSNLLPPLASILQQNNNMAFFPYWNMNLQLLAAQQQAVVLAQLSPRERELALQQLQNQQQQFQQQQQQQMFNPDPDTEDEDDDDDVDCKSIDSAMDLSQPAEEERRTPENVEDINTKLEVDINTTETPIGTSVTPSRRKGRVLQLDTLLQVQTNEQVKSNVVASVAATVSKLNERSKSEESLENRQNANVGSGNNTSGSASSTSNDSGTATSPDSDSEPRNSNKPAGAVHECKYCDIYFKDPVLYTIHMGYHSCDDVFKCNMCGEKCDGPVGLFVHMARNAHA